MILPEYPLRILAITVPVVLAMSTLHSMMGFAFGLLATPVLLLVFPPKEVVVVTVLLTLFLNLQIVLRSRKAICRAALRRLTAPIVLGLPVGLWVLSVASPAALKAGVGVTIVALSLLMLCGWHPKDAAARGLPWLAGLAGGVLTTSINFNGPPIVLYLQTQGLGAQTFRATTAATLMLAQALALVGFLIAGFIESHVMWLALFLAPVCLAGYWLGTRMQARLEEALFLRLVLVTVVILGLVTIATAEYPW